MIPSPPPPDGSRRRLGILGHGPGDLRRPAGTWGALESLALFIVGNLAIGQLLVAGIVLAAMGVQRHRRRRRPADDRGDDRRRPHVLRGDAAFRSGGGRRIGAAASGIFLNRGRLRDVAFGFGGGLLLYGIVAVVVGAPLVVAVPGGLRPAGEPARADRDEHLLWGEGPRGAERGRDRADHRGALFPRHPLPERPRPSRGRARRARAGARLRRRPRAGRAVARRALPADPDVFHRCRAGPDLRAARRTSRPASRRTWRSTSSASSRSSTGPERRCPSSPRSPGSTPSWRR